MRPVKGSAPRRGPEGRWGGKHPERLRRRIEAALDSRRIPYEFAYTRARGHAAQLAGAAVKSGCTRVLVAGGDGTVMEAVSALADSDTVLGLIPVGTGNQLAANLRIPARVSPAVDVAVGGEARRIDVGMIDGRPFTCMAGAGFDTAVVNPDPRLKRAVGYLGYVIAAVKATLRPKTARIRLTLDGDRMELRGVGVEVANLPGLRPPGAPWPVRIIKHGAMDDGQLDVCVLAAESTLQLIGVLMSFLTLRPERNSRIRYYRAREITVDADPILPVQADGELFGNTPFTVRVRPRALAVAVPEG